MDLKKLFIEDLNYEPVSKKLSCQELDNNKCVLDLEIAFEKNEFCVICCKLEHPDNELEKALIKNLKKQYPDALYLFTTCDDKLISVYNIKLTEDKKERLKKLTYDEINNKTKLFMEKVRFFEVSEDVTGKLSLKEKIDAAFDTEKITRKFYDEFKKYHDSFIKFIKGIPLEKDAQWYASVLLNRLMFIYFIQKKGFIDNDYDYLKNKFNEVDNKGNNFYSDFLMDLFSNGFANKEKTESFKKKYGDVPYLNGGLFLPHPIESQYKDIAISNSAFKEIIGYFDRYIWYLDERPLKSENEINPDVLGYIFEKYINQKDLGAYYTKEDITGYICRNTIIPFIFDTIGLNKYADFLKEINIEDYIYDGITNREERIKEIKKAHKAGEVKDINSFITFNLDIEKLAIDYIDKLKDEDTIKILYFGVLKDVKILDPTVGSGAFLFAALNILFPMYERIINKKFIEFNKKDSKYWKKLFEHEIDNIKKHPNVNYFILKTIIVNNLYGVDIVEEATEICKLRLFLKLASQIEDVEHLEPLPDIDFNIKAGNTLIGIVDVKEIEKRYTYDSLFDNKDIKNKILDLDKKLSMFRSNQLALGQEVVKKFDFYQTRKKEIQKLLNEINLDINKNLQTDYGIKNYKDFIKNYKPFNWYIEFNDIIKEGGFDVIIGNPPYVEYSNVRSQYQIKEYKTEDCGNLYAFVVERSVNILKKNGRCGMIVPLSAYCTDRMEKFQQVQLKTCSNIWLSHYAERPSKLFDGVERNLTIFLFDNRSAGIYSIYSTKYLKWNSEDRNTLFKFLAYTNATDIKIYGIIPKVGTAIEVQLLGKLKKVKKPLGYYAEKRPSRYILYYRNSGGRYWKIITDFQPDFFLNGKKTSSSRESCLYFSTKENLKIAVAIFNSTLYYWFYAMHSDTRTNNPSDLKNFSFDLETLSDGTREQLCSLCDDLMADLKANSIMQDGRYRTGSVKFQQFYPAKSKHIIDKIDKVIGKHYNFSKDEIDFIINYDIKFRMGKDDEDE